MIFSNRSEAGRLLAERLLPFKDRDPVVLALVRGGLPVAYEVAHALGAPLDIVLVRKIGAPGSPELAAGAVVDGANPEIVRNPEVVEALAIGDAYFEREAKRELAEIERRRKLYLGDRSPASVEGKTAIVIDDGIATGTSARAALRAIRRRKPRRLVFAAPVGSRDMIEALGAEADEVICLDAPDWMGAVGMFYRDFRQVEDDEVIALLDAARTAPAKGRQA